MMVMAVVMKTNAHALKVAASTLLVKHHIPALFQGTYWRFDQRSLKTGKLSLYQFN